MSLLKASITEAMKAAMRAKDKQRLSTLRLVLSEFKRIEVDERIVIEDDRALLLLDKMLKQRRDSIQQYQKAERPELAAKEQAEVDVIQSFMPAQLSSDEIQAIINDAIDQTGADSMKAMGALMAIIKPQVQGRADMAEVSQQIKSLLN